jgi:hypothetical protein
MGIVRGTPARSALLLILGCALLAGCVSYEHGAGLAWRGDAALDFEAGRTTESDVLERLGPPSQMIALADRTVFYYLRERTRGRAAILVFYNRISEDVTYDTAVFFFDARGVLTEWAQGRRGGGGG